MDFMVVLLLEGIFLYLLIKRLPDHEWRRVCFNVIFASTLWLLFWLVIVQWELSYTSVDGTYGSDARYYYEVMLDSLHKGLWWPPNQTLSPGYVAFGMWVLYTAPNSSVVWVKLANIGLFLLAIGLSFHILQSWNITPRIASLLLGLAGLNGIISWMVLRNLKDTLFLFLSILITTLLCNVLKKEKYPFVLNLLIAIFIMIAGGYIIESIRPWGIYWAFTLGGAAFIETLFFKTKKRMTITNIIFFGAVGILILSLFSLQNFAYDWSILINYSKGSGGLAGYNIISLPVAISRFLIGPGPIRAVYGTEVFQVTTSVGNVLITLGAMVWWLFLPFLILTALQKPSYYWCYGSIMFPLIIFLAVYTFAYSGSLETRFRAIIYFLSFMITAPFLDKEIHHLRAKTILWYSGIELIVIVGGTVSSLVTLM